ncbi:cyclin-dependent kinase inhibitor 1C-like, partial [Frankliniella occidentalis]|uniref:Cyclin-dependent kinase inhibitor 1C-like n=1 Tax=Frankliniella occidentalis TaxID=133901 RepID=A0A9C6X9H7_FRAOC
MVPLQFFCFLQMDLEKLRQARLQRYSGVTSTIVNDADISAGETASAGGNVEEAEPTQAVVSELVYSSLVPSSNDVIAGTLTEIRDLLLQLPANIAAALAGSIPAAVQSVSAAAPSPAPLQATVAASLQVPHTAPPPLQAPVAASLQVPAPPPLQPPAAPLPSLQGAMQIAPQPSNDSEPDEPYPVEDSQVDLFS